MFIDKVVKTLEALRIILKYCMLCEYSWPKISNSSIF